jgi:hypothetical protein
MSQRLYKQKTPVLGVSLLFCPGEDSNFHPVKDMALNHARLPVPPPGHIGLFRNYRDTAYFVNAQMHIPHGTV